MDTQVTVAIIVNAMTFLTALVGAAFGYANKLKIQKVEVNVDGKLAELTAALKRADQAEGYEAGRVAQIVETATAAAQTTALPQIINLVIDGTVRQATLTPLTSEPVEVKIVAEEPVPVVVQPKPKP